MQLDDMNALTHIVDTSAEAGMFSPPDSVTTFAEYSEWLQAKYVEYSPVDSAGLYSGIAQKINALIYASAQPDGDVTVHGPFANAAADAINKIAGREVPMKVTRCQE